MVNKLLAVALIVLAYSQIQTAEYVSAIFLFSCLLMLYINRAFINITSLIAIIGVGKLIEIIVWMKVQDSNAYVIHSFYAFLDLSISLTIAFRASLLRKIENKFYGSFDRNKYVITNADLFLGLLYSFYFLINLITLFEHSLRHLDDFGLEYSEWLYQNARFFWSNYANIKLPLNILEFGIIIMTVQNYMRSERVVRT